MADIIYADSRSKTSGSANADTIMPESKSADNATVDAGAGNDLIGGWFYQSSINAGDGNDTIVNAYLSTVNGGKGDDLVYGRVVSKIEYADGDGNDTVSGFNESSILKITSGEITSAEVDGLNAKISIGTGSVLLTGMAGRTINISDAAGTESQTVLGTVVEGDDGNNRIANSTNNAIIRPGTGNDIVSLSGSNQIVEYEDGKDTVYGINDGDTIRLHNWFDKATVSGNDVIFSGESAEDGGYSYHSLTLKNAKSKKYTVVDDYYNNEIYVPDRGVTLDNSLDTNQITNLFGNVTIDASKSKVSTEVYSRGDNVKILLNDNGSDAYAKGKALLVKGGAEGDNIGVYGDTDTYVSLTENATVDGGGGNDYIWGFGIKKSTIGGGAGEDNIDIKGSESVSINGGAEYDVIGINGTRLSTIDGGEGDDDIHTFDTDTQKVVINGGAGNDQIFHSGVFNTINGGAGSDYIDSWGRSNSIFGGNDDDEIYVRSGDSDCCTATILGGKGNDRVNIHGNIWVYQYASGDGDDVLEDLQGTGIIHITSGNYSVSMNDSDFVITVDSGKITLKDRNGDSGPITIKDKDGHLTSWAIKASGEDSNPVYSIESVSGSEIVERESTYLIHVSDTDTTVSGEGVYDVFNYKANISITPKNNVSIFNYGEKNTIKTSATNYARQIRNIYGSNVLIETDTDTKIQNTGDNATIKAAKSGSDAVSNEGNNVVITAIGSHDKWAYILGQKSWEEYEDFTTQGISNLGKNVTVNGGGAVHNYGDNFILKSDSNVADRIQNSGANAKLTVGDQNDVVINTGWKSVIDAGEGHDSILNGSSAVSPPWDDGENSYFDFNNLRFLFASDTSISGGDGNDFINNYSNNVTINGGAGNDTIRMSGAKNVFVYKSGEGDDVIYGIDPSDSIKIGSSYSTALGSEDDEYSWMGRDVILTVGSNTLTFKNAEFTPINIDGKVINDVADAEHLDDGISYTDSKKNVLKVSNPFGGELYASDYAASVATIDASENTNDLMLVGNEKAIMIRAGSGKTTLVGGMKNDNLIGNNNSDTFVYTLKEGADVLTNVEAHDVVSIGGTTFDKLSFTDNKNVVTVAFADDKNSKLTINKKNTKDAITFRIGESNYTYGDLQNGILSFDADDKKTAIKVSANATETVKVNAADIVSTAKTIDGSAATVPVDITGNDNANILVAGKAGSTLYGGKSTKAVDDKLYGDEGADVFVYTDGDGKDQVYNFNGKNDIILLPGETNINSGTVKVSANKVTVSLKNGTLTLNDPQGRVRFYNDTDTTKDPLYGVGIDLPDNVGYNAKKTAITVSGSAPNGISLDLSNPNYPTTVKDIDASVYGGSGTFVGNDQKNMITGGTGSDTLVFVLDKSADTFKNVDPFDVISISGGDTLTADKLTFTDKGAVVNVAVTGDNKSKLTINKRNSADGLQFQIGNDIFTYGSLPGGAKYDKDDKKTEIILTEIESDVTLDASMIVSTAKNINASLATHSVNLTGNAQKNVITAGDAGSTLYGGTYNVADKLIGGKGADVFVYREGDGKDVISNFDGKDDVVMLPGIEKDKFDSSTVTVSTKNVVVKFKNGTLTLDDPQGEVRFVNDSDVTLYSFGINFPNGIGYNAKKTAVVVGSAAADVASIDLRDSNYLSTAKDIDASVYGGNGTFIGNTQKNVITGGTGSDTLVFMLDQSADTFKNVDPFDVISLSGGDTLTADKLTFTDKGAVVNVAFDGDNKSKLAINKRNSADGLQFQIGNDIFTYGSLPGGAKYDKDDKKTEIILTAIESDVTLDASMIVSTAKNINATLATHAVNLTGNDNANVITAGNAGSTLYGGKATKKAVADKLVGGGGKDVFVYYTGDGKDQISNFNGADGDYVLLPDIKEIKDADVKISTNKIVVTIGKESLTLNDPQGQVRFFSDTDTLKTPLYSTGINFPSGVGYNDKKTAIIVSNTAENVEPINLNDSSSYQKTVKEVDASKYTGRIEITGNAQKNVLYAGEGGSVLDGGYDSAKNKATNDILHGNDKGSDTFVWDSSTLGGSDQIFNYDPDNDIISVKGSVAFDKTNFSESGKDVVLTIGKNKLTVKDVKNADGTYKVITAKYSDANSETQTVEFGKLPTGVLYSDTRKALVIGEDYAGGTINAADFATSVVTLNAAAATGEVVLFGSKKAKVQYGGTGKTTLIGSTAADVFNAGTGSDTFIYKSGDGKDVINGFNTDADVIVLEDSTVGADNFSEKGNDLTLTVGKGSLTLKDMSRGANVKVVDKSGTTFTYKTLPANTTYKAGKLTLTKDFSGELSVADLGALPVKEVSAAAATKETKLIAGSTAVKFTAGKGGSEMVGSSENDTLVGGNGNDVFQTSGGSDVFDKYTEKKDKIVITGGTLTDGKVVGTKDVELTFTGGKATVKGVLGKELSISDDSGESKYTFTRTNNTLEKVKAADAGASEFAASAEDYWFTETSLGNDEIGSMLGEISTADDAAISAMSADFEQSKQLLNSLAVNTIEKKRK